LKYVLIVIAGVAAGFLVSQYRLGESRTSFSHLSPSLRDTKEDKIGALIKGLRSPDPKARYIFHKNLVRETDMFFRFKPSALPEEREAAVRRWERWWANNHDKTKEQWLTDSLKENDYEAKLLSARKLAELKSEAAIPAITSLIDSEDAQLRIEACRALGTLSAAAAVDRLCGALKADPERKVRRAAARSLGLIGTPGAASALAQTATDTDLLVRIEAVEALVFRAPQLALPVLHSLLADGDKDSKLFAIDRLSYLRSAGSVPPLVDLLEVEGVLSKRAHEALNVIVGKDLGSKPGPWLDWYEKNSKQKAIQRSK